MLCTVQGFELFENKNTTIDSYVVVVSSRKVNKRENNWGKERR